MSFSVDVKTELCRAPLSRKCCAQAEAYGVLLYCNTFHAAQTRIVTENEAFAQRLPPLFKRAFKLTFDRLPQGGGKQVFEIADPAKLAVLHQAFGSDPRAVALHVNFAMVEENCCRAAFLRGAFLAGGSVTDPRKGYHLELATSHHSVSREVLALMRELDQEPKSAKRKGNAVLYFKQSEKIEDFFTCIGAPLSAMEVMNAKLERDLRGKVNRRVNCDAANLDKAVEAVNRIAPEHLELCVDDPFLLLPRIKNAGSVFLGRSTPEALGDYFAGPNHTLPTSGTARVSSPLGVDDFMKRSSFLCYDQAALNAWVTAKGLPTHSMTTSAPPSSAMRVLVYLSAKAGAPRWTKSPLMTQITAVSGPSRRRVSDRRRAWPQCIGLYSIIIPAVFTDFLPKVVTKK